MDGHELYARIWSREYQMDEFVSARIIQRCQCNALQVHVRAQIKTNIVYISNKFPRLRPMNHVSGFSEMPRLSHERTHTDVFLVLHGRAIMKMRFFTALCKLFRIAPIQATYQRG